VEVYNQTGPSGWPLVGSVTLTVHDTRPCALCVTSITPNPIDLASAPASFTIAGQGFTSNGFGAVVLGQSRGPATPLSTLSLPRLRERVGSHGSVPSSYF
jgi:hypothetical protein